MSAARAVTKFTLFALICLLVPFIQLPWLWVTRGPSSYIIPRLWQGAVTRIFGVRIKISGQPYTQSQTIYISNHLSHLDIPVIGGIIKGSFVAKKDIKSWPVMGFLCGLQQTAFISRDRADAAQERQSLNQRLIEGKNLIIFPEGTTTDGSVVLPFKSSLFALGFHEQVPDLFIQPVTLTVEEVDGRKVKTQADRDVYAWSLENTTPFAVHLWNFAKGKGAVLRVRFHPAFRARDCGDRKTLANRCHEDVSNGLMIQKAA
jgi:1-acyl-sn-glycerol-3-phosphate acyltransferase